MESCRVAFRWSSGERGLVLFICMPFVGDLKSSAIRLEKHQRYKYEFDNLFFSPILFFQSFQEFNFIIGHIICIHSLSW